MTDNKKSIILYNDASTKVTYKIQKIINKNNEIISGIITPVGNNIDAYIFQKISNPMINFTKANIKFNAIIKHVSQMDEMSNNAITQLESVDKEITDIVELFQYIHSINRLKFVNRLSNSNESPVFEIVEFTLFELKIFSGKNETFSKKMTVHSEKGEFGPREVLKKIRKFYNPTKVAHDDLIAGNEVIDDKIGFMFDRAVYLEYTNSYTFFSDDQIRAMRCIKSSYMYSITGNMESTSLKDLNLYNSLPFEETTKNENKYSAVRYHDIWGPHTNILIEYITYLEYNYNQIGFISEINDTGKYEGKYHSVSFIEMELYTPEKYRSRTVECDSEHPVSISYLLDLFRSPK